MQIRNVSNLGLQAHSAFRNFRSEGVSIAGRLKYCELIIQELGLIEVSFLETAN